MSKKIIRLTEEEFTEMLTDIVSEQLIKEGAWEAVAKFFGNAFGKVGSTAKGAWDAIWNNKNEYVDYSRGPSKMDKFIKGLESRGYDIKKK